MVEIDSYGYAGRTADASPAKSAHQHQLQCSSVSALQNARSQNSYRTRQASPRCTAPAKLSGTTGSPASWLTGRPSGRQACQIAWLLAGKTAGCLDGLPSCLLAICTPGLLAGLPSSLLAVRLSSHLAFRLSSSLAILPPSRQNIPPARLQAVLSSSLLAFLTAKHPRGRQACQLAAHIACNPNSNRIWSRP
jgi:hypothetical protein